MPTKKGPAHAWLKGALADRGHTQHDVAVAWGCDDAVISRFIATGTPELTWERGKVLARMLGMDIQELDVRLAEGVAPRRRTPQQNEIPASGGAHGQREEVVSKLRAAVEEARKALPNSRIDVKISHGEEET